MTRSISPEVVSTLNSSSAVGDEFNQRMTGYFRSASPGSYTLSHDSNGDKEVFHEVHLIAKNHVEELRKGLKWGEDKEHTGTPTPQTSE